MDRIFDYSTGLFTNRANCDILSVGKASDQDFYTTIGVECALYNTG